MNKNKIIVLILLVNLFLFGKIFTNIEGEGFGSSKEEAIINAKRNALERSVGMILSSKSLAKNNMLINDKILTRSEGFIKKYELILENVDNGIYQVKIKADIANLIDDILKDEFAIKFLIGEMGFPKFGVIIKSKDGGRDKFAENIIIDNFIKSYFNVCEIPENGIDSVLNKIDFIIQGSVDYSTSEIKSYNIENMYSVHTKIECQIKSTLDNTILSSDTFTTKKAHFDPLEAKRQSIDLCSDKISKFLIEDSIEKWSRYYNEELEIIDISIANISYDHSEELHRILNNLFVGIESIVVKEFKDKSRSFKISSLMSSNDVLEFIKDEISKQKYKIKVNSISKNQIKLELF
ncbi:MAG: hypothetical protein PF638_01235 [Candidatus Delongbacteria bacterium]|jgi:hypothetical protein|nr:hypothetical protein [Candidatus Delongbacteria bacterium]